MSTIKAYRASAACGNATADTPKAAAEKFFALFPTKRKCTIIEGKVEGQFFIVTFGRASEGKWPQSWRDITKRTMGDLPNE